MIGGDFVLSVGQRNCSYRPVSLASVFGRILAAGGMIAHSVSRLLRLDEDANI